MDLEKHNAVESEWLKWREAQFAEYVRSSEPPCIAFFYSASAFFDTLSQWWEKWNEHIERNGRQWFLDHGLVVEQWSRTGAPIIARGVDALVGDG